MSSINLPPGTSNATPDEILVADTLEALVNGRLTSQDAAHKIDSVIITDLKLGKSDSHPLGWEHHLWDNIGRSAMVIPADHPGQENLVSLLRGLQQLPRNEIVYTANGAEHRKVFWSLNASNGYSGFAQWLWELKEGGFTRHERPSEDVSFLSRNFAAFVARLLANGIVEATRLSDLVRPSLFAAKSPSASNAEQYNDSLRAASQWILYAGDALYEMCQKETLIEIPGPKWTPAVWSGWKVKFKDAAESGHLNVAGCEDAEQALAHMGRIEERGVTTNVCDAFGFTSIKDDDDE